MKLAIRNLGRRIEKQWLWRNLDFEIFENTVLAVEGPTGAGKTLLLRCLAFLDLADEGSIIADDKPVLDWNPPLYRSKVMLVPQKPFFSQTTVEEELKGPFLFSSHHNKSYSRSLMLRWLSQLQREEDFLSKRVENLSGGERQLLACLRALALDPDILILDEPTASLDPKGAKMLMELVLNWLQEKQRSLIFTSHRSKERMSYSNTTLSLVKS